jgi:FMN phosphatase YigB (HAD superfamily)
MQDGVQCLGIAGPRVLVFDLGGVLVDAAGLRELPGLLRATLSPAELRSKWLASPSVLQFETGRCRPHEFAAAFVAEWDLDLDPAQFLVRFRAWVMGPFPGIPQLLSALGSRYMLACLSNTNIVHWEKVQGMDGVVQAFSHRFVSHEIGLMKPSPAIYAHVVRELGCGAGEIAFFDDGQENIDAAAAAGLSAHLTVGPDHLRSVLTHLGAL